MKKTIFLMSMLGFTLSIPLYSQAETIVDQDIKKATFDIVSNPEGTLLLEVEDLSFGNHTIVPGDINAITKADSSIKVTEYSGERPGWTLRVNMGKFSEASGSALNNVKLFYPKVDPYTTMSGDFSAYKPDTMGGEEAFLSSPLDGIIVNDKGEDVLLAEASQGKGFGKWVLLYEGTNRIQLRIPEGQRMGAYSATLTYTLVAGP